MAFTIKNITKTPHYVFGAYVAPNGKLDLSTIVSNATIISSLFGGELFDKITGKIIAVIDVTHFYTLGATTDQINYFARVGYLQGKLGLDDFKDPFVFSADGYLVVSSVSAGGSMQIEGLVVDGDSAAGINPIIIAGVDEAGNAQNLIVNSDGYLMTSTAISIETNSEVEGRVADGGSAAGVKPVIVAGVDESGNAQNLIVNSDGYLMTSTAISVETNAEVEGRVADGSSVTSIKPILIGGQDEDGYAQSLLVSTDGEVHVAGYDAALDAVRTFETAPLNYFFVVETLVNATNQAAATYYYTTTIDNYKDLSLEMEISANITITIEASNDIGFTTAKDITKSGNELVNGSSGYVSFTTGNYILDFDDINVSYVRVKAIISSSPNSLKIVARKKAL